ncbi:MAG: hypothetical protein HYV07_20865 [Deltaproteobacteria bacterium]|nr:hypothetical protein [Deltaproteobacteria bacterium]
MKKVNDHLGPVPTAWVHAENVPEMHVHRKKLGLNHTAVMLANSKVFVAGGAVGR